MKQWFNNDSEALRSDLIATLDEVWDTLSEGSVDGQAWRAGESLFELTDNSRSGSVAERAEGLVGDLFERLVPQDTSLGDRTAREAVQGFCRQIFLAIHWDDEEEEEEGWSYEAEMV
ncbi:MAG: hypothetical protein HN348_25605 [Proteobacteria bacterium]|nr:hypothetical protein [Pseudomonadota bacterium]